MEYIKACSRYKKNKEYYRATRQLWSLCLLLVQIPGKPGGVNLKKNKKRERNRKVGLNPQIVIAASFICLISFVGIRTIIPALKSSLSYFLFPYSSPITISPCLFCIRSNPDLFLASTFESEKKNYEVWFPIYVTFILCISIYANTYIHSYVHTYTCMLIHKYTYVSKYMCINLYLHICIYQLIVTDMFSENRTENNVQSLTVWTLERNQ